MILQIPFTNDGAQTFIVQLGDVKYRFIANFNEISNTWILDIYDPVSHMLIVGTVALVIGSDLFAPYNLNMGRLYMMAEDASGLDAGPDDLGARVNAYWFSADE